MNNKSRREPSSKTWVHLCMGSEGCMVKEEGRMRDRPRRIAYPMVHVDAVEIVASHNLRIKRQESGMTS